MKGKRTFSYLALLGLLMALVIPLAAAADGCPPENPNCRIEPPQSIQVNANPMHADGSPVELPEPGMLAPQLIPMPLPPRIEPLPLQAGEDSGPSFDTLSIPMRHQDPDDVSCGVQALGMALDGLDGSAPSSTALLSFLEDNDMLYDFGTGVEELAFAAQSFGFEGAFAFHDWTLDDLKTELDAGRPVVVALGSDGEAGAGHFVTVTGISPDGQWIAFNDPTLGEQVLPTDEFLRLWSLQGSSGVAVRRDAPSEGSAGYAPWVALLAGMMALITQTPLVRQRKGIGGSLEPGGAEVGRGSAPPGYRWVFKQMPKYEWQEVQEGWDVVPKTVPNMVQKYEQVGWTTTTQRIPRYETIQVQDGWTYTYVGVPTYRTERYIRYWRTEYTYQATYRYYYGMRI